LTDFKLPDEYTEEKDRNAMVKKAKIDLYKLQAPNIIIFQISYI
jgi:hypothetical protein